MVALNVFFAFVLNFNDDLYNICADKFFDLGSFGWAIKSRYKRTKARLTDKIIGTQLFCCEF